MNDSRGLLSYGSHQLDDDDIASVVTVLRSGTLTQGPAVPRFEAALESITSVPAVCVSSGTAALHLAYAALGLGPGDEIITSPLTFVATANAARLLGAEVRFADVDQVGNIDPESVAQLIGPRTRGVVAVHFAGQPANLQALGRLTEDHKIWLVEDAAHALGATYEGAPIGAFPLTDATLLSFHPVKHITTGEGGAVLSRRPEILQKVRLLREHGIERTPAPGSFGLYGYEQHELGFNYRLSDIGAALGHSQLAKLPRFLTKRRELAALYRKLLAPLAPFLRPLPEVPNSESAHHIFPVLLELRELDCTKGQLMKALKDQGIGTQVHYLPVSDQPYYQARGAEPCPQARAFSAAELTLPLHPGLEEADVKRVVAALGAALQKRPQGP